jgi:peroxiredoxin
VRKNWLEAIAIACVCVASSCRTEGGSSRAFAEEGNTVDASAPSTTATPTTAPANATGTPAAAAHETPPSAQPVAPIIDRAELGQPAPDFALTGIDAKTYRLSQFASRTIVLEWFNPRSPYCVDAYKEGGALRGLREQWVGEGVVWLAINSEAPSEPGGSVEDNREFAREHKIRRPLLMDPTGAAGKAFGVKRTPTIFIVSKRGLIVYRGALDNAPTGVPPDHEVKMNYVDMALSDLSSGHSVRASDTRVTVGTWVQYAR